MKKSMKHSIFPETSSPIPCKKPAQFKQRAATHFVDIEREVLSSGIATNRGNATGVEENDERSMTEVNSKKVGRIYNKEKYPMSDTSRFRLLLIVITEMHSSWGTDFLKGRMGNPQEGEIQIIYRVMRFFHFCLLNLSYHCSWHCFYSLCSTYFSIFKERGHKVFPTWEGRGFSQVMIILILIDVQYLLNAVFSFEKRLSESLLLQFPPPNKKIPPLIKIFHSPSPLIKTIWKTLTTKKSS